MRAMRKLTAADYAVWCAQLKLWQRQLVQAPCDCPGCAPHTRAAPRPVTVPIRGDVGKALDAIAVANAIRFAGLNTPDSKRFGAAQTLAPP